MWKKFNDVVIRFIQISIREVDNNVRVSIHLIFCYATDVKKVTIVSHLKLSDHSEAQKTGFNKTV